MLEWNEGWLILNVYNNAVQWEKSARKNFNIEEYRTCVYCCCLSIELYLKSQLLVIDPNSEYETSHDVLAIYQILIKTYKPTSDIKSAIRMSRKYHNESRYPGSGHAQTKVHQNGPLRSAESEPSYMKFYTCAQR